MYPGTVPKHAAKSSCAKRNLPFAQALLDMLAGFAAVASGTDAGGGSRQYVRPVLTEVGWAGCEPNSK